MDEDSAVGEEKLRGFSLRVGFLELGRSGTFGTKEEGDIVVYLELFEDPENDLGGGMLHVHQGWLGDFGDCSRGLGVLGGWGSHLAGFENEVGWEWRIDGSRIMGGGSFIILSIRCWVLVVGCLTSCLSSDCFDKEYILSQNNVQKLTVLGIGRPREWITRLLDWTTGDWFANLGLDDKRCSRRRPGASWVDQ